LDFKLVEILAIYGATLSTFVFIWNVVRSKRRISVKLIYGIEGEGDDFKSGVYVFIQNPSSSVVHISGISILYPWRKAGFVNIFKNSIKNRRLFTTYGWVHTSLSLYGVKDGCPISIEPGHAHKVLITDKIINEILEDAIDRKIMASVQDQLWNETRSKKFGVQPLPNEKSKNT